MTSTERASVVVTSYNYERFLGEAIESALAQAYPRVEVVVVDDGSTDASRDVIAAYADRVVPVLKENGGQGSAFNAGFRASGGQVVCFLDSDDFLLPDAVARAVEALAEPGVVNVRWPLRIVDADGQPTGGLLPREETPEGDLRELVLRQGPFFDWHLTPPTSGHAWSRGFLERVLPMPEPEYRVCADEYLLALSPVYGTVRRLAEPAACYRAHGANSGWQRPLDEERLTEDLARFERSCAALAVHLRAQGTDADPAAWKERNWNYLWLERLRLAREDLLALVPPGDRLVLVNDGEWPPSLLPGRTALPLPERNGVPYGRPADDVAAVAELERQRAEGARFAAFWWTCFWWLDHYAGLREHLRSHYPCVLDNDRLLVFELR